MSLLLCIKFQRFYIPNKDSHIWYFLLCGLEKRLFTCYEVLGDGCIEMIGKAFTNSLLLNDLLRFTSGTIRCVSLWLLYSTATLEHNCVSGASSYVGICFHYS